LECTRKRFPAQAKDLSQRRPKKIQQEHSTFTDSHSTKENTLSRFVLIIALLGALALLVWLALLRYRVPTSSAPPTSETANYIEPSAGARPTGTVRGRVLWNGEPPTPSSITGMIYTEEGSRWATVENPFTPKVDPKTRGVAGAVVWLNSQDPKQSKAWSHGPLQVEMKGKELRLKQDGTAGTIGFVRLGEEIEIVSREPKYHSVRARGAAFFTLPFPQPDQVISRKMTKAGRVDLMSGAGYFWCGADLFVCEHPYYTVTDVEGRFELTQVPEGNFTLTTWLRPWEVLQKDRDPETGRIVRLHFPAPLQKETAVKVASTGASEVEVKLP
jgi:hypothetical protein